MLKKLTACVLATLLLVSAVACTEAPTPSPDTSDAATTDFTTQTEIPTDTLTEASTQVKYLTRRLGHNIHSLLKRDNTLANQLSIYYRKRSLKTYNTHSATLQTARLLFSRMRCMVSSHHIDSTILQTSNKSISISSRTNRGIHLKATLLLEVHIAHRKVVGTCLASYLQTTSLRLTN